MLSLQTVTTTVVRGAVVETRVVATTTEEMTGKGQLLVGGETRMALWEGCTSASHAISYTWIVDKHPFVQLYMWIGLNERFKLPVKSNSGKISSINICRGGRGMRGGGGFRGGRGGWRNNDNRDREGSPERSVWFIGLISVHAYRSKHDLKKRSSAPLDTHD